MCFLTAMNTKGNLPFAVFCTMHLALTSPQTCTALTVNYGDVNPRRPARNSHIGILLAFVNFPAVDLPAEIIVAAEFHVFMMLGVFESQGEFILRYRVGVSLYGYPTDAFVVFIRSGPIIDADNDQAI